MANDNNDIVSIVKKCKILLLDIEGTTTSISFVKDKLFPYAEENVKEFLDSQWEREDVKQVVAALRKLALEDQEKVVEGVVAIPGEDVSKEDQIDGMVKNVKWQMGTDRKVGPLKQLQGLIWKQGYDKGEIKGHVYDDVQAALEQWRSVEGQKVYIYSSGSVQAQKLLFGQSVAGDLLPLIDGHFDTAVGGKQEPASYTAIAEKIGCPPEEILFLTDIVKEGEAGRSSGLQVALVCRSGDAPETSFPVLQSLAQLTRGLKRKPDAQVEEEQPAKLLKTDSEEAVKADKVEVKAPAAVEKVPEEPEKMEVEEPPVVSEEPKPEAKTGETTTSIETVVEEVTDSTDIADIPVIDAKPIVTEEEKTENKETEKMDTDTTATVEEHTPENKESDTKTDGETVEENPVTVITEIEEVTNDKQVLNEVPEIEDIEPVVEEPPAVEDMEELQNVGEVLEKECDEILSKVQDVTNLDNIPLKPLLNPIAEESMDTENGDTNDIMEGILDSEAELEMKQCGIDLNTVTEMSDSKPESETETVTEEVNIEKEKKCTDSTDSAEDKSTDVIVGQSKVVTDEKIEESSPKEATVEENKVDIDIPEKKETETTVEKISTDTLVPNETKESASVLGDAKDGEKVPEKSKAESANGSAEKELKEVQVNGKTTNGDADTVNQNGDVSKDEELSSRLSVENGKEVVNGANGKSGDSEQGQGDNKLETEIKVKTVASDEPRTVPIEQPTEA